MCLSSVYQWPIYLCIYLYISVYLPTSLPTYFLSLFLSSFLCVHFFSYLFFVSYILPFFIISLIFTEKEMYYLYDISCKTLFLVLTKVLFVYQPVLFVLFHIFNRALSISSQATCHIHFSLAPSLGIAFHLSGHKSLGLVILFITKERGL
jgi:hypothetical protein